jgi:HAD superfamily hydrolase (TIGR01549 family)
MTGQVPGARWVCLDVGETLIDETRIWSIWADVLGMPTMTFLATFGATVAMGREHVAVFDLAGRPEWRAHADEVQRRFGGFQAQDLYPDALPALERLRATGYRTAIVANQPARRTAELRALGFAPDVMAMSEELGVAKPDARFYARALELMGDPAPDDVAYVGDRPDNDVAASAAAGLRAVWLRRGPWGIIHQEAPGAVLVVGSLTELAARVGEAWPDAGPAPLAYP